MSPMILESSLSVIAQGLHYAPSDFGNFGMFALQLVFGRHWQTLDDQQKP